MKRMVLSGLAALSLAAASFATASPLTGSAACQGEVFNPINDPNWNNMFPVTVAGISMGGGSNPPRCTWTLSACALAPTVWICLGLG